MKTSPRAVVGLGCWLLAASAQGHQDPWGDIYPHVAVMDGKFAIDFKSHSPDQESDYTDEKPLFQVIYNADGSLFAPRHAMDRKRSDTETGPAGIYGKSVTLGASTLIFEGNQATKPGYILKSSDGKLTKVALPWPEKTNLYLFQDVIATPKGIAITSKETWVGDREEGDNGHLFFYWFDHGEAGPPVRVDIGETACIYDFPIASNLVFAGGRFWVGLMRPVGEKMKLALWSWKPGEKDERMELLDSPASSNSHLSLAAIGDQLCLAYHCVVPDEHGERNARILTVFRKAE